MDNNSNNNNQKKRQKYPEATPFPCTINSFEKMGWSVAVVHLRQKEIDVNTLHQKILPNGGSTHVAIAKDGNLDHFFSGRAICNKVDNFNKKIGITKALGRAFSRYLKAQYPGVRGEN